MALHHTAQLVWSVNDLSKYASDPALVLGKVCLKFMGFYFKRFFSWTSS